MTDDLRCTEPLPVGVPGTVSLCGNCFEKVRRTEDGWEHFGEAVPYETIVLGHEIIPYDRARLVEVLVYHQRTNTSGCHCGWGDRPEHLGKSWAEHVANVYEDVAG